METITRGELQRMHYDNEEQVVKRIIERVKQAAKVGNSFYLYREECRNPDRLIRHLREILIGVDIEYADPYITIRWG